MGGGRSRGGRGDGGSRRQLSTTMMAVVERGGRGKEPRWWIRRTWDSLLVGALLVGELLVGVLLGAELLVGALIDGALFVETRSDTKSGCGL